MFYTFPLVPLFLKAVLKARCYKVILIFNCPAFIDMCLFQTLIQNQFQFKVLGPMACGHTSITTYLT